MKSLIKAYEVLTQVYVVLSFLLMCVAMFGESPVPVVFFFLLGMFFVMLMNYQTGGTYHGWKQRKGY